MDFEYITANVPGAGADLEAFRFDFEGCDCVRPADGCCGTACCASTAECACLRRSLMCNYDADGRLLHVPDSARPIMECAMNCACQQADEAATSPSFSSSSLICGNRVVQMGVRRRMKVVRAEAKGFGVVAAEPIRRGEFVVEYVGEIISEAEMMHRHRALLERRRRHGAPSEEGDRSSLLPPSSSNLHNYTFAVVEHFNGRTSKTFIDARFRGNLARFINHSCAPNLFPQVVRTGALVPRLALFAHRDIPSGEELSYSYSACSSSFSSSSSLSSSSTVAAKADNVDRDMSVRCLCGAANCAGALPATSVENFDECVDEAGEAKAAESAPPMKETCDGGTDDFKLTLF